MKGTLMLNRVVIAICVSMALLLSGCGKTLPVYVADYGSGPDDRTYAFDMSREAELVKMETGEKGSQYLSQSGTFYVDYEVVKFSNDKYRVSGIVHCPYARSRTRGAVWVNAYCGNEYAAKDVTVLPNTGFKGNNEPNEFPFEFSPPTGTKYVVFHGHWWVNGQM
jgi:hypothetical protein